MKAVLIEDKETIRENLRLILEIYVPQVEIIGEAAGVQDGLQLLRDSKPELVFLDISMDDGTGFDLLALYGEVDFKLIFISGHDEYALKAFKFSAIDYIVKPVDPDELVKAVKKAEKITFNDQNREVTDYLQQKGAAPGTHTKVQLSDKQHTYWVNHDEIVRCEASSNYTIFYLIDQRQLVISKTLKHFEETLPNDRYFRPHQSHIINLTHLDQYLKAEGGELLMKDGSLVPLANRRKEAFLKLIQED